jgi:amidophosphoribosyltransferase
MLRSDGIDRNDLISEACGVFAVVGHEEASNLVYLGLHGLQHRGQESVGIVSREDCDLHVQRRMGLVGDAFDRSVLARLPGDAAIGHVRYSTSGDSSIRNAQPVAVHVAFGPLALAHNGNLTNAARLRSRLEQQGSIFQTATDTEVIAHLAALSGRDDPVEAVTEALRQVTGAYSMVAITDGLVFAVRDPYGVRPLVLGRLQEAYIVASETSSLDLLRADFVREVRPGEMLTFEPNGFMHSSFPFEAVEPRPCVFELVYFSRPDSVVFGRSVYQARKAMGRTLASESPVDADVVIPVPDSGLPAALGYAEGSGLPFEMGLIRSHYVGRTFIEPSQSIRHFGVKLKLSPVASILAGKRVVVVDDSIVRGTTCRKIVAMIREAGAREVHFRVASPPTRWPCFYGIDTPERSHLVAARNGVDEIEEFITANSLAYLSMQGLRRAVGANPERPTLCEACFSGEYPIELADQQGEG